MRRLLILFICNIIGLTLYCQTVPKVVGTVMNDYFPLCANGHAAAIFTDANDYAVVSIAAAMLADDVERVTGQRPILQSGMPEMAAVVAGTLGHNPFIDQLVADGKMAVDNIKGKWESFVITTIKHPKYNCPLLVVAGSDRRGTAFGLTSLSEAIGVSPWYWWADVTPSRKPCLYVEPGIFQQGEPSVKYRGFFINDERFGGWARWAEENFDREHHEVGPKTYQKVFELLLRLKGNYLWPAMHPGTKPFNFDPENARLADDYAIVMGTSHCEQMLRNNEGEWKAVNERAKTEGKVGYGDFNYITNRQTMQDYWEERIKTNGRYENTYTLGLRGVHDYPMEGANSNEERVALMQQAINDQRDILKRNIHQPIEDIPQVLCTYEEVLDAYHSGLQVPDDITLLWSDDKQGYMRNLCNPQERQRKGGAGVYYHLSYHGDPDSWFWLSPLSPALIATELTKAYEYGADRIWVFNVGDIKPAEKELSFAMELAWDINRWKPERAHEFIPYWISKTLSPELVSPLTKLQNQYYRLMAYGKEFHTRWLDYSEQEIYQRLCQWDSISAEIERMEAMVPASQKAAFFELFTYPMKGAALMNRYVLTARRSMVLASEGNDECLSLSQSAQASKSSLDQLTDYYNRQLLDGKWNHFFNWHPNWYLDGRREVMQVADTALLEKAKAVPVAQMLFSRREGYNGKELTLSFHAEKRGTLPLWVRARTHIRNNSFAPADNVFCQVMVNGTSFTGSAQPHGNIWHTEMIGPIWSRLGDAPIVAGENRFSLTAIDSLATIYDVFIGIQPPFDSEPRRRILATDYIRSHQGREGTLTTVTLLGYVDGVTVMPFLTDSYDLANIGMAPWVEYDLQIQSDDSQLEIRTLPTLRVYTGREARYAVSIDGGQPVVFSIHEDDYSSEWRWNVLRGYTRRILPITQGRHTIRIYLLDPGIVLQEILVK